MECCSSKRGSPFTAVSRRLRVSWDELDGIEQRAVRRGLARRAAEPIVHFGVDETSFQRRHEYVTVVSDLERGRVVHVADGRGQQALEGFCRSPMPAQRAGIQAVAMDRWRPYIQATQAQLPGWATAVCFDRFHVAEHLGEAVNDVRKSEQRVRLAEGDERLKRTRFLWLMGPERRAQLDAERRGQFDALRGSTLKVARAWAIKEMPLAALLGLVHLRVTFAVAVPGRTRSADNRGIDGRAGAHPEVLLGQLGVDRSEDLRPDLMGLEQMAELTDRRVVLVRHRLTAQVDTDELPHGAGVIERFLDRRVGEAEPVLQAVGAQPPLQPHRRTTRAFALRVHRRDQLDQWAPRYHPVDIGQKLLPPRALAVEIKPARRQCLLLRSQRFALLAPSLLKCTMLEVDQRIPDTIQPLLSGSIAHGRGWNVSVNSLLRRQLERLLHGFGYELKVIGSAPRGFSASLTHARNAGLSPRTVFDVGVGRGTPWLYGAFPQAKHVLFEPLGVFQSELERLARDLHADIHRVALSNRSGTATFRRNVGFPTSSSLYSVDARFDAFSRRVQATHHFEEETVELRTLDELNSYQPPYVLKLDVEGAERDVIQGATRTLQSTELLIAEISVMRRRRDEPGFADMIALLDSVGFELFDVPELSHGSDGTLLYIDAAFVPKGSNLWPV